MIDVDGIRDVLKKCNVYVKENTKNFVCSCPYCGDHKDKHKKGHLYVSKNDNIPVCHCWLCNGSWQIQKLLLDLTGDKHSDLIVPVNNQNYVKKTKVHKIEFKIPELDFLSFPLKSLYIKRRTFNKLDYFDIPNLIFDIKEFFRINGLKMSDYMLPFEEEYIQDNMVAFLSKRNTILYCRAISDKVPIKFKKITLRNDVDGLDYYCIDNNNLKSDIVVLSEGNFDILGCYSLDTLELKNKARVYCAGCTFSYEQLLKSVCLDFGIYKANVYILSDSDKNQFHYKNFIHNTKPFIKHLNIYYNSVGKDFGNYPHLPVKLF
jgi:hypothetical protein